MKKKYSYPMVEVIKIEPRQMIALSAGDQSDPNLGAHEDFFDFDDDEDFSNFESSSGSDSNDFL